jgi:hypothetical protein
LEIAETRRCTELDMHLVDIQTGSLNEKRPLLSPNQQKNTPRAKVITMPLISLKFQYVRAPKDSIALLIPNP